MEVSRALIAACGTLAVLATTALGALHVVLAASLLDITSPVRTAAIVAAILEALTLVSICYSLCSYIGPCTSVPRPSKHEGLWFVSSLLLCVVAASVSVMVMQGFVKTRPNTLLGSDSTRFLIGAAIALGVAFTMQLVCVMSHLPPGQNQSRVSNRSLTPHVKSVPYQSTCPTPSQSRGSASTEPQTCPGSSGGISATETMSSFRSSLSHIVRPITSKTKLLPASQRSSRHGPTSAESNAFKEKPVSTEYGFDSWDTSAVDPLTRQTVLMSSSPSGGCFLETIPASPTTSRSPSPGTLDLEPPKIRSPSCSHSLGPGIEVKHAQRTVFTLQKTSSEAHIHPLFRSDSQTPPPVATKTTAVIVAPDSSQVISDRGSIRSLNLSHMHSHGVSRASSPPNRPKSNDSFHRRLEKSSPEFRGGAIESDEAERTMTPPIPEWILSAGSRKSLCRYNSRKMRCPDVEFGGGERPAL